MTKLIGAILVLLILFLFLGFTVLNPSETVSRIDLWFLGTVFHAPLVLVVFVSFLLGFMLTLLFLILFTARFQLRIRQLKKQNREYERELVAIRNIPVEETSGEGEERPSVYSEEG